MYKRHAQSFTASGLEMITSARYQIDHPLATLASPTGYFSSRWVTCCLTGTQDGQIDVIAWQATEQCEALVKANAIEASVDPSVVRVRKPKDGEYIPEVFYSYKNEYGLQVKNPAKPTFPVEYLMVSITHGFPNSPDPLFLSTAFPIENRPGLHDQSMEVVVRDLMKILQTSDLEVSDTATWPVRVKDQVAKWLSDWHLVAFLCMHGTFSADEQKLLAKVSTAHRHPEAVAVREHLFATSGWQTLLTIAESMAPAPAAQFDRMGIASPSRDSRPTSAFDSGPASGTGTNSGSPIVIPDDDDFPPIGGAGGSGSGSGDAGGPKACPHCTFINDAGATDCDVCGLPL
jgi:nuclear protein localization family protein 4